MENSLPGRPAFNQPSSWLLQCWSSLKGALNDGRQKIVNRMAFGAFTLKKFDVQASGKDGTTGTQAAREAGTPDNLGFARGWPYAWCFGAPQLAGTERCVLSI